MAAVVLGGQAMAAHPLGFADPYPVSPLRTEVDALPGTESSEDDHLVVRLVGLGARPPYGSAVLPARR